MDARGIQRMLEKLQGLAESAEQLGIRNIEMIDRETSLSEPARQKLALLYREESLRLMHIYAALGETVCDVLRAEAVDNTSRGLVDLFQANFAALRARSRDLLSYDIGHETRLDQT